VSPLDLSSPNMSFDFSLSISSLAVLISDRIFGWSPPPTFFLVIMHTCPPFFSLEGSEIFLNCSFDFIFPVVVDRHLATGLYV